MSEKCNKSKRTIERRKAVIKRLDPNSKLIKDKSRPHKLHYSIMFEFLPPDYYETIHRMKQMSNTIKCLKDQNSLPYRLTQMDWDFFGTISYKYDHSANRCFDFMHHLYEAIENYSFDGDVRMFFSTESFANRTGYHNHFVLKAEGCDRNELLKLFEKELPTNRPDLEPYDEELAGLFYVAKHGLKEESWDILGNNLSESS